MEKSNVALVQKDSNSIFKEIPTVHLKVGKYQPRKHFSEDSLASLAETIKRDGVLEPLLVRHLNGHSYEIIAGERRWRAGQCAGLETLPCLIKNCDDEQAARIALIENTNREDLDLIEEAQAINRIIEEFGYTHEEMAAVIGKPRSVITNMLRLLKLDSRVQVYLRDKKLTEAHGKMLAGLPLEKQYFFASKAVKKNWTTRLLELAIKNQSIDDKLVKSNKKDINISKLEQELSDKLGHPVSFTFKKDKSGVVNIVFHNYESFDAILAKLGYDRDDY